ncbi:MAG: hypothetical protein ACI8Z1_001647 [Candidatus Azotimanducaceae bacterium]|jgi:hypothetical protein
MSISVIGAGFGRTGTLSLKSALETLGYNKCHHMIEVIHKPGEAEKWLQAIDVESVDWDDLLEGYQATVDWPACHFYQELADYYPRAKVLLSVRDPQQWFESMSATTLGVIRKRMQSSDSLQPKNLGTELVVNAALGGEMDDPAHGVRMFNQHTKEVIDSIAPDRLLVFDVREGWEPLCQFLDKPVPTSAFPRVNSRDEFEEIFFGRGLQQN